MPSSGDLGQRKIKGASRALPRCTACADTICIATEKASWLGLSRGTGGADHWRSATCRLYDYEEGCRLHVYIDVSAAYMRHLRRDSIIHVGVYQNTVLYASIFVHVLNHTDIRHVHRSLFDRKDCLGLFCSS